MHHLQQIFQLQQWTPYKVLESSFIGTFQSKCPRFLNLMRTGFSLVNSDIINGIAQKKVFIASSVIGLSAFAIFGLRKIIKKQSKIESQEHENKVQSNSDKSLGPQNQQTDLPKWLRQKGDNTLEEILELSKQESTCGDNIDSDKVFFEVYKAYLETQQ